MTVTMMMMMTVTMMMNVIGIDFATTVIFQPQVLPIVVDKAAFPSAVPSFTFQYEKIFIMTSSNTTLCISLSPKGLPAISSLLLRTGVSDAQVAALCARHGPNQFIVEIPAFAEVVNSIIYNRTPLLNNFYSSLKSMRGRHFLFSR